MEAAGNGNGVDRHLFGLWCAAYEAGMPVPALFEDELYTKRYKPNIILEYRVCDNNCE